MLQPLVFFAAWALSHMVFAQLSFAAPPNANNSTKTKAAELLNAPNPLAYGMLVRKMFDHTTAEDIDRLESDVSDAVAIQAAWERIRRTMKGPNYITKPIEAKEIDPQSMQRFLGFVSGRLQVPIPKWWSTEFERQRYLYPGYLVTVNSDEASDKIANQRMKAFGNYLVPNEFTEYKDCRDAYEAVSEKNIFRIPKQALMKADDSVAIVVNLAPIDKGTFAVASHPEAREPYALYVIDGGSQRVIWKSEVFCENIITPGATGTGFDHHWSEIVRDKDERLLIFGACDQSMYIEGFEVHNGALAFRFSTSY